MDASQYKDYVLTLLFVKYVSDKYGHNPNSLIEVPEGATFDDMVALKGKSDIGDQIDKKILKPLLRLTDWKVRWNLLILMTRTNWVVVKKR